MPELLDTLRAQLGARVKVGSGYRDGWGCATGDTPQRASPDRRGSHRPVSFRCQNHGPSPPSKTHCVGHAVSPPIKDVVLPVIEDVAGIELAQVARNDRIGLHDVDLFGIETHIDTLTHKFAGHGVTVAGH